MCSQSDDPTQYDLPTCEARFWNDGADRRCAQTVGVKVWQDFALVRHTGCPKHIASLQHRYPEVLPVSVPGHGRLSLATPWARGAFGPADRIDVENLVPQGWEIGVSVSGDRSHVILWALDPDGVERARWTHHRLPFAVKAALDFARYIGTLAGDPVLA